MIEGYYYILIRGARGARKNIKEQKFHGPNDTPKRQHFEIVWNLNEAMTRQRNAEHKTCAQSSLQ